jgi:hypothetical protein
MVGARSRTGLHTFGVMRKPLLNDQQVQAFLESLFEEDLHAKRVLSLSYAVLGVIHAASLGVHTIGKALAWARGTHSKHGVKQVDRLLSNQGINVWELFALWVPYVLGQRSEALVALDWTDFDDDGQTTLVASLVASHGRTTAGCRQAASREDGGRWRIGGIEAMLRVRAGAEGR